MSLFLIISGDDDFARKQRAKAVVAELSNSPEPENAESVEIIPGDSPALKMEDIATLFVDALRTPPFLCDRKIIWMRHHPDLDMLFKDDLSPAYKELFSLLTSPLPPEVDLVIDGPGLDRRRSRAKELKKAGAEMELCTAVKSTDKNSVETRRAVIEEFSRTSGKQLTADARQYLIEVIGGDSGTLANELKKLDCYTGNSPEITMKDCLAIISRTQDALSWELTSAVVESNCAKALLTLARLLAQKESGMEIRLLYALSKEYQSFIQTKLAMKQLKITRANPNSFSNLPPELKEQFPDNPLLKMHPFRAFKTCEAAGKISGITLAEKLTLIRNANCALVSGGGDSRILLEELIIKLCR